MIMGSEGRSEQTLKTDQDNAIVYAGRRRNEEGLPFTPISWNSGK
jgi:signal-transduction protein with cAMP-binding, CBS, and nucleotidyltransferase domain